MTQIALDSSARADVPKWDATRGDHTHEILPDLAYQRLGIVNLVYYGVPHSTENWVLIDAGLPGTANAIRRAVDARFGDSRPECIILTHAHADHAGALENLVDDWQVPVFAHDLELPYLNGVAAYPPPDASVG